MRQDLSTISAPFRQNFTKYFLRGVFLCKRKRRKTKKTPLIFIAYLDRMKFIRRWPLMRCTRDENIMEHSQCVALITHALCAIKNTIFGGHIDEGKAVLYAVYHETSEVMTGDLPTPVKYYNRGIQGEYKSLEKLACEKLVATLPKTCAAAFRRMCLRTRRAGNIRL